MKRWIIGLIVLLIAGGALYTWLTLKWTYSSGERVGYVRKLSHKGWICKTWEGQLSLVSIPGTSLETFYFTVPDAAVAGRIQESFGKRVALTYEQHKGIPTTCFGETEYFITDVRQVE